MIWLGIETSCDETAVALVAEGSAGLEILGSKVSSQIRSHQPFGGVVPELAVREHLRNLPGMVPSLLKEAALDILQIDAITVTEGPGLAACLMIGHSFARALGIALNRPVYGINHLEGHLLSPFSLENSSDPFPCISLLASGGHTVLILAHQAGDYEKLGGTVDDAAGEAFDKVARMLGLSYPGGPEIETRARGGTPNRYEFPQSFPERDNFNFSFSGLKTSVRYFLEKHPHQMDSPQFIADVCASFQEAVVQVLVRKTILAAQQRKCRRISAAGGVLCNGRLRALLRDSAFGAKLDLKIAPPQLCTDNAAMIAAVGAWKHHRGMPLSLGKDIDPNMSLDTILR